MVKFLSLYCFTLSFLSSIPAISQSDTCHFISPVRYQIISSGSFGEPRSSHFHGGIDIKTHLGAGRDELLSIGDGFVSRVRMTPGGYGKALYVDHPCGYTSVYAHMDRFIPSIQEYVDKVRLATKKSIIDQKPPKHALRIKKGQVLGYMGNSGNSFGAHLHFEIRKTDSETPINPVLFGIGPKDNISPVIRGIVIYNLDHNRKVLSQSYQPARKISGNKYLTKNNEIYSSWPLLGFGLHVYDQSNGAGNHNGIHNLDFFVNGEKRFSFKIDSIPFDKSQYLHAHMDYEFKKKNKYVHKCYKDPGNPLQIYTYTEFGQLLIPNDIVADHIEIVASDVFGNKSSVSFKIKNSDQLQSNQLHQSKPPNVFRKDTTSFVRGAFEFTFPPNTFLSPKNIKIDSLKNGVNISSSNVHTPLFANYTVKYDLKNKSFKFFDIKKITAITIDSKGRKVNLGGRINNSSFNTQHNELGSIFMFEDTEPPKIVLIKNQKAANLAIQITDNLKPSGKNTRMKYNGFVNDVWIPLDYDEKNNLINVNPKWLTPNKTFRLDLEDFNGNKTSRTFRIDK